MACAQDPQLDIVTCSLCLEIYNDSDKIPKGLPCMHTFCLDCLQKYVESKMEFQLLCPLCQSKFMVPKEGVEAIPTNFIIRQLLQNVQMEKEKEDVPSKGICDIHKTEGCDFACQTCHVLLCDECVMGLSKGSHSGHTLQKLPKAIEELQREYEDMERRLKKLEDDGNSAYHDIKHKAKLCKDEVTNLVEKRADKVIAQIIEWKNTIVKTIARENNIFEDIIKSHQCDFQYTLTEAGDRMKQIKPLLGGANIKDARIIMDKVNDGTMKYSSILPQVDEMCFGHLSTSHSTNPGAFTSRSPVLVLAAATKAPVIEKVSCFDIESPTNWCVGIDSTTLLLANETTKSLLKYTLSTKGVVPIFEKSLPDGISASDNKYFLQDGRIVLRDYTGCDPTRTYSSDLKLLNTSSGDYGRLIGVYNPNLLVYSTQGSAKHGYELRIYDLDHKHVMTIQPKPGMKWSKYMSVTHNPCTRHMAIVDYFGKSLHITDSKGCILHHKQLTIAPRSSNAVSCDSRFIYIIQYQPASWSVHNWDATLLLTMDDKMLGIQADHVLLAVHTMDVRSLNLVSSIHGGTCAKQIHVFTVSISK